jgi:hypothetical protein
LETWSSSMTKQPDMTDAIAPPTTPDEASFDLPPEKRGLRKCVEDVGMRMAGNCGVLMRALCFRAPQGSWEF